MGKHTDFTIAGGFPMTQTRLAFLQSSYKEEIAALAMMGAAADYCRIYGAEVTNTVGDFYDVTEGWIFYNGKFHHVPAVTGLEVPGVDGGNPITFLIVATDTTLTYYDASTHDAEMDTTVTLCAWPIGTDDDFHAMVSAFRPFEVQFGARARGNGTWSSIVVATDPSVGGVTGTIWYLKDTLSNELLIRAELTANNSDVFPDITVPMSYAALMGTLPTGYRPSHVVPFSAQVLNNAATSGVQPEATGYSQHLWSLQCVVGTDGDIYIRWICYNPSGAAPKYKCRFNLRISLD